ncbi:hypothetical protein MRX96_013943 [Rhipicephalus microplus]
MVADKPVEEWTTCGSRLSRFGFWGDIKNLMICIRELQWQNVAAVRQLMGPGELVPASAAVQTMSRRNSTRKRRGSSDGTAPSTDVSFEYEDDENSDDGSYSAATAGANSGACKQRRFKPEIWKTVVGMLYFLAVTWITAIVMVIVHDRVPDMQTYPPLPDIFLDNVPHIPWAFAMCEFTGLVLFIVWHLQCKARHVGDFSEKIAQAFVIWQGGGMLIQGVRTCGDYMFSGHTTVLTLLNFFITEYTPRSYYFLHTTSWVLNLFGIFFILSAHEHYSIDVFIAFYISTRLFLYYHTLANNRALMQMDSKRTRIWFPLFYFFESGVDGIVPNEYDSPLSLLKWFKRKAANIAVKFKFTKTL